MPWLDLEQDILEDFASTSGFERQQERAERWRWRQIEKKRVSDQLSRWRCSERVRAYRAANRERHMLQCREWYARNREAVLETMRETSMIRRSAAAPLCQECSRPCPLAVRGRRRYCSTRCYVRRNIVAQAVKRKCLTRSRPRPPCKVCGAPRPLGRPKYCSQRCRNKFWNDRRDVATPVTTRRAA